MTYQSRHGLFTVYQEYGYLWDSIAPSFIKELVKELYKLNYRIITGHARGVGSYVISSVIEECQSDVPKLEQHLMIKAFPYEDSNRSDYNSMKTEYRKGIFKYAGIAIFIFGNKIVDDKVVIADGVYEEYELAKASNAYIIPIGSTGYAAEKIWHEVFNNLNDYPYLKSEIQILKTCTEPRRILQAILKVLNNIKTTF